MKAARPVAGCAAASRANLAHFLRSSPLIAPATRSLHAARQWTLTYPYPRPPRSYFFHCASGLVAEIVGKLRLESDNRAVDLRTAEVQDGAGSTQTACNFLARGAMTGVAAHTWALASRVPVLAYGSNAAPEALFRKFGKHSLVGNDGFIPVMKVPW